MWKVCYEQSANTDIVISTGRQLEAMPNAGQFSWKGGVERVNSWPVATGRRRLPDLLRRRCPRPRPQLPSDAKDDDEAGVATRRLEQFNTKQLSYRVCGERDIPELLLQVLVERQWVAHDELAHGRHSWNLCWTGSSAATTMTTTTAVDGRTPMHPWQYSNRIPGAGIVTRKDTLLRALRCMRLSHGAVYDFSPSAFILPNDYVRFAKEFGRLTSKKTTETNVWICKPTSQSCGRGITIFRDLHRLSYSAAAIVQSYVCNPLLVSGYKFDLRLYVCIACFRPLVVYVYHDGLARYATEPFDLRQLRKVFAHLTNSSLNKFSPAYDERKGFVGLGCKWTLGRLRRHLRNTARLSDWLLWARVMAIVLLTVLCEAPRIEAAPTTNNAFELYGFDIIVDDQLAPWLLEVNRNPSLEVDCDADVLVKKQMLHDLLDLLDLENSVAKMEASIVTTTTTNDDVDEDVAEEKRQQKSRSATKSSMMTSIRPATFSSGRRRASTAFQPKASKGKARIVVGSPSSAVGNWESRFGGDSPPDKVGGFVRVFPVGSSIGQTWRGQIHTRSVVGHVRRLMAAAHQVDAAFKASQADRIPDDEEYQAALQELVGNDSVFRWIPRL